MTDPLSPEEIEEKRAVPEDYGAIGLSRRTYFRLLDIAEDHAQLHAENAKLRERAEKFRALEAEAAEHVEVQLLNRTDFDPDGEIVGWRGLGLALTRALDERDKLRKRVEKLERVRSAAAHAWGMAAFPDQNYGLSDALAACDEEGSK